MLRDFIPWSGTSFLREFSSFPYATRHFYFFNLVLSRKWLTYSTVLEVRSFYPSRPSDLVVTPPIAAISHPIHFPSFHMMILIIDIIMTVLNLIN